MIKVAFSGNCVGRWVCYLPDCEGSFRVWEHPIHSIVKLIGVQLYFNKPNIYSGSFYAKNTN